MKNYEVQKLHELVSKSSYTTVSADESYKIFAFIRKIGKIEKSIDEQRIELARENKVPVKKDGTLNINTKEGERWVKVYSALLNDDAQIEYKRISPEAFMAYCKESKFNAEQMNTLADALLMEEE